MNSNAQRQLITSACLVIWFNGSIARIRDSHEKRHDNDLTARTISIHVSYKDNNDLRPWIEQVSRKKFM